MDIEDINKDIEEEVTCDLLPAAQLLLTRLVVTIIRNLESPVTKLLQTFN